MTRLVRYALLALGLALLSACGARFDLATYESELISEGETIYLENCSRCHQLNGDGFSTIYPNLAGNPLVTLHDPVPIINVVLNGQGSMPAFKHALSPDETAAVLSYIRNAWGNRAPAVYPKQTR